MQTNSRRTSFAPFFAVLLGVLCLGTACAPSGPKALLQGEELIRKGKYEAAIEKLELATQLIPSEARAWNYLGIANHRAGRFADARLAYERALRLDRNLAIARYNLGKMYMDQGVPSSASEQLSTYVMLEPKSTKGWLLLGDANRELMEYDEANKAYYAALHLNRDIPAAYNGLGMIRLKRQNPQEAYRFFIEALKHDPNYTPAILNRAVLLHSELDRKELALTSYREYVAKVPDGTDTSSVRELILRLERELNPPSEPVQVASLNTNITNLVPAEEEEGEMSVVEPPPKEPVEVVKTNEVVHVEEPPREPTQPKTNEVAKVEPPQEREPQKIETEKPTKPIGEVPDKPVEVPDKPVEVADKPDEVTDKPDEVADKPVEKPEMEVAKTETEEQPLVIEELDVQELEPESELPVAQESPDEVRESVPVTPEKTEIAEAPPQDEVPQQAAVGVEEPEEKRGFFQRINPANLFRGDDEKDGKKPKSSREIVTPLPGDNQPTAPAKEEPPMQLASTGGGSEEAPVGNSRGPQRYRYLNPAPPAPGDRATAERLFQRALSAQTAGNSGRAASYFTSAAMADPSYFPAQYNAGLLSYQTGQTMKSLSAFETALALDPDSIDARYNFALSLKKANYPLDAVEELNRVLEKDPADVRAHLLLGNVYAQNLNNIERARSQYQTVLELDSQHRQAPAIRAWLKENP